MKSLNEEIYKLLVSDDLLLNQLGENMPILGISGVSSQENSVVPADLVVEKLNTPFITIQEGTETKIGSELKDASMYIRCYNDIRKSYVEINVILDRVRELLDGANLVLSDRVHVSTSLEARMPGLVEEPLELKFKEERYRVKIL